MITRKETDMTDLFLKILNMSISASWVIIAVLLIRLLLKKTPKWVNCVLWGIVALRLVMPFSFESVFSLIPSSETINRDVSYKSTPAINSGVSAFDDAVNPIIEKSFVEQPRYSVNPLQILLLILSVVWLIGIAIMFIYTAVSYFKLRKKISNAVLLNNNIYQSENVTSPFVIGIIKPKIYLPFNIDPANIDFVIAHEQAHIKRRDYIIKPIGFVLLAIYWFNPLVWLSYVIFCRDIEFACDEKVVKNFNREQKADYSNALLHCSINRKSLIACPIAFGEVGVKHRIKSVLNYKKPAFWVVIIAVVAVITVSVCFLTNPVSKNTFTKNNLLYDLGAESYDDIEKVEFMFDEYDNYTGELFKITKLKDIEKLGDYTYSYDWPDDKLHEILVYPNNRICITINDKETSLFLHDDGSLTLLPPESPQKTYKAKNGKGITDSVWNDFIKNYSHSQNNENYFKTFLYGETTAADSSGKEKVLEDYFLDKTSTDFEYTFLDMTGDGIDELCVKKFPEMYFFTIDNDKIYHWYTETDSYAELLNNKAFLSKIYNDEPAHTLYSYYELDKTGNKTFEIYFSEWDSHTVNGIEYPVTYTVNDNEVSEKEYQKKTKKYLSIGNDEINWQQFE